MHANYVEQERKAKVKKVYSTLANAMTFVKADGGNAFDSDKNDTMDAIKQWFDTYLAPRLITTKVCYNTSGCWSDTNTKRLDGTNLSNSHDVIGIGSPVVTAILNDGTFINLDFEVGTTITNVIGVDTEGDWGIVVYFDIDGKKGPNQLGKDVFLTVFTEEGFVPAYKSRTKSQIDTNCSKNGTGHSCINKYIGNF